MYLFMSKAQKVEPFADLETAPVLRKQRLFEAGQMKLLALHLISFAPKYGYDLIKEVGEIVGGGYCPSAGTIYPTLNYLEGQQFVQVALDDAERKQYRITALGLKHLEVEQASDSYVSIHSSKPLSQTVWIADNNVLSLEAERKKNE